MAVKAFSYPHPVFGNNDDITVGKPQLEVIEPLSMNSATVKLQFKGLKTGNETIDALLESGTASWAVQILCGKTYFRETYWLHNEESAKISIPADDLLGNVHVETHIVSCRPVPDYQPQHMHSDYEGCSFDIQTGSTLAIGTAFSFPVDPGFDPMRDSIASIISITEGPFHDGPFQIEWDSDTIDIAVSANDWTLYPAAKNSASAILHASLVLPVLSEAVRKSGETEYQDCRWGIRLRALLSAKQISDDDPLLAAQYLLSQPLNRVLEYVQTEMDGDGE